MIPIPKRLIGLANFKRRVAMATNSAKTISLFTLLRILFVYLVCASQSSPSEIGNEDGIEPEMSFYSDYMLHDIYHSALRRVSSKAYSLECKKNIEFEFMKNVRSFTEVSNK